MSIDMQKRALAAPNGASPAALFVKTLGYVRGLDRSGSSPLEIGIVYDPESPVSREQAQTMMNAFQNDSASRENAVNTQLINVSTLDNNVDIQAMIVTSGMSDHYSLIKRTAVDHSIFSMGLNAECARQQACIVAIEDQAVTKVYLNEVTMDDVGFDIDTTFRYLAIRL